VGYPVSVVRGDNGTPRALAGTIMRQVWGKFRWLGEYSTCDARLLKRFRRVLCSIRSWQARRRAIRWRDNDGDRRLDDPIIDGGK
jgi:hypothetical protein